METFGAMIATARRSHQLTLYDVAKRIFKANGDPITVSYLCELEHDRKHPALNLLPQFAAILAIPEDALYFTLGLIPPDIRRLVTAASYQQVRAVFHEASKLHSSSDEMRVSLASCPVCIWFCVIDDVTKRMEFHSGMRLRL